MMELSDGGNKIQDIRNFVNFKKIPGGQRDDSYIVGGVVFTKNIVHKEMAKSIEKPRVLLLQHAIVYQRKEGKYDTIESLRMQEQEHLRNVTARILNLKPNVVLVHKNVSGIAQDMLRNHGITLVLDVKQSVLERLSRFLKCDIVDSIESKVCNPRLGKCEQFYTRIFHDPNGGATKTLMFFDTMSVKQGCSVLLHGANHTELVRVKRVALMLLFARFNWRFELSFLLDEFARPPSPKASIFDSKDHSPTKNDENQQSKDVDVDDDDEPICDDVDRRKECRPIPLQKSLVKNGRKSEEILTKENVKDFSDPLRAKDLLPSVSDPSLVEFAVEMPFDNKFRTALSSTVLSVSPFVTFPLPYLETENGRKCALRAFYPNELYYSKQWSAEEVVTMTDKSVSSEGVSSPQLDTIATVSLYKHYVSKARKY